MFSESENRRRFSLDQLKVGAVALVVSIDGRGAQARRMMEMGLVPGAPVRMIKAAPLGDPLEINVRSYRLALRRAEAQAVTVTFEGVSAGAA